MRREIKFFCVFFALLFAAGVAQAEACTPSAKPVFLTFDTGHMAVAPLIAEVLQKHDVRVTFFLANEKTKVPDQTGSTSLDDTWKPWWQARAREGHAFGSHTFDHVYWLADTPRGFRVRATAGKASGQVQDWTAEQYCAAAKQSGDRFFAMTGKQLDKRGRTLFRAPGGKTSPKLIEALHACGFEHIGWSAAGFLGDELPSDKFSNQALLDKALDGIKSGDVLMAHLGIWSRLDPWAPTVLEPLIVGLKARGFCFKTLAEK
jgi:peptidoglycan-N-acetylmuramic acid deacetylase